MKSIGQSIFPLAALVFTTTSSAETSNHITNAKIDQVSFNPSQSNLVELTYNLEAGD